MKTWKSLYKEQKLTTWVNVIYIKEKYQKQKADEDRILETDCIEEKERGLSSKAAWWLDSHVWSSEWITKKTRFQEREHDLEVKDLRVHRRHWPSERLNPRKEGNTCFPKTGQKEEMSYSLHMYLLSTYYFLDYSRHTGYQCTNKTLILMKLLFQLRGRGRKIGKAVGKYWAIEDETWWTLLLVQRMIVRSFGVRWAGMKIWKDLGCFQRSQEKRKGMKKEFNQPQSHEPLTQDLVSRLHLLWLCRRCAAWDPWLSTEEGRCPEPGTGKASTVKGYRALGLQIPR